MRELLVWGTGIGVFFVVCGIFFVWEMCHAVPSPEERDEEIEGDGWPSRQEEEPWSHV